MCRSGCPTQDHESYGACLRAANTRVAYANSVNGWDYTKEKKWRKELSDYRAAVKQGIEPAGTDRKSIDQAVRISNETGKAYDDHKRYGV